MKSVFDFDDDSWSWFDLAEALKGRYGTTDLSELIMALMNENIPLVNQVKEWDMMKIDGMC